MVQKTLILLLLALPSLVAGQTFQASVIGGFNFSQIDGDDLFGFHKPGVNAGIRVVAVLGDRWRVGPEILYSQQGAKRQDNSLNISPYDAFRLNTLEVPLMAYYKDWRLVAEAGFSYQRLFSYEVDDSFGQDITPVTELQDNLVAFKAGVTYLLNPNWGINMQWSKHLLDIDVEDQINTSFKGRSVSLRLVYTFGQGEALPKRTKEE
ncbi:outer membrane beta-barrel protein [Neolewinella lacunae]|uniref:Porin family protein n=1 Tax=Neolewinella lacunae TaxID=1517758 RepID=A0A923PHS4_9BACT|nr:outer membrane beta-barrel protein [Neolewinella lacunae]MBC6994320.1 porin family protein [Neolewinella lacunae]MDN3634921.1 outer membrane beta-barrel protein [Neolewinella lacunae]